MTMKWADIKKKLKDIGRLSTNRRTKVVASWLAREDEGQLFIGTPAGRSMVFRFLKQRRVDKPLWAEITKWAVAFEADERPIFKIIKRLSKIMARDLTPEDRWTLEGIRRRAITRGSAPNGGEDTATRLIERYTTAVKYPDLNTRTWHEMLEYAAAEEAAREAEEAAKELTDEELGLVDDPFKPEPLVNFEGEDGEEEELIPDLPPPPPPAGKIPDPLLDLDFGFDHD